MKLIDMVIRKRRKLILSDQELLKIIHILYQEVKLRYTDLKIHPFSDPEIDQFYNDSKKWILFVTISDYDWCKMCSNLSTDNYKVIIEEPIGDFYSVRRTNQKFEST